MVAVGVAGAYSSYQQGQAAMSSAKAQAESMRQQGAAIVAQGEKQSELVEDVAKYEGKMQAEKSAQLSSSQRAALAANGVDLSSGTAEDLTLNSMSKSAQDEAAIRYNADSKAWSIKEDARFKNWSLDQDANMAIFQGKQAKKSANIQAGVSLLGAAVAGASGAGLFAPAAKTGNISYTGAATGKSGLMNGSMFL
jgi:hypothetical protein